MKSVVLIVPAAQREAMAAIAEGLGYGTNAFGVECKTGSEVTHYGTHVWAEAGGQFDAMVSLLIAGQPVPGLEAHTETLAALIASAQDESVETPPAHFDRVAALHGIVRVA